jgi:hypothetical protein
MPPTGANSPQASAQSQRNAPVRAAAIRKDSSSKSEPKVD